jgi:hypothetical protein
LESIAAVKGKSLVIDLPILPLTIIAVRATWPRNQIDDVQGVAQGCADNPQLGSPTNEAQPSMLGFATGRNKKSE